MRIWRLSRATYKLLVRDSNKQRVCVQMLDHPQMKILDITDRVNNSTRTKNVGVL